MKRLLIQGTDEGSFFNEAAMTALRVFADLAMAFGHGLKKLPPPTGIPGARAFCLGGRPR